MLSIKHLFESFTTPADRASDAKYFKNFYSKNKPTTKKLKALDKHPDISVGADKN